MHGGGGKVGMVMVNGLWWMVMVTHASYGGWSMVDGYGECSPSPRHIFTMLHHAPYTKSPCTWVAQCYTFVPYPARRGESRTYVEHIDISGI